MFYKVQLYDKYENELMDSCCNIDHLFIGQECERLYILHKIAIHISSVLTNYLTVDTHTLLTYPYQIIWRKYDAHVA